jgi:hypothetical protein
VFNVVYTCLLWGRKKHSNVLIIVLKMLKALEKKSEVG